MTRPLLVLGTTNRKKGQELAELLSDLPLDLKTLGDFPEAPQVLEDAQTFADNAAKSAEQIAAATPHLLPFMALASSEPRAEMPGTMIEGAQPTGPIRERIAALASALIELDHCSEPPGRARERTRERSPPV